MGTYSLCGVKMLKICCSCKKQKDIDCFHKNKSTKDGIAYECKDCKISKQMERYNRDVNIHRSRLRDSYIKHREKRIESCKKYVEENKEFVKDMQREYYVKNREYRNEQNKIWAENNPEKIRQIRLKYKHSDKGLIVSSNGFHKRRAKILNAICSISKKDIAWLKEQSVCFYCNTKLTKKHIEHFIPLAFGGTHTIENVVISCPSCNFKKGSKELNFIPLISKGINAFEFIKI